MKRKKKSVFDKLNTDFLSESTPLMGGAPTPQKFPPSTPSPAELQQLGEQFYRLTLSADELRQKHQPPISDPATAPVPEARLKSSNLITISDNRIGCLMPELMPEIHKALYAARAIDTIRRDFIPHYTGGKTKEEKIVWLREINLLIHVHVDWLMEDKIIPPDDTPFKTIADHFCDRKGNNFTPDRLRRIHGKGEPKFTNKDLIRYILLPILKKWRVPHRPDTSP